MKQMKDIPFKQTYGDMTESFQRRVQDTLHRMEEEKPKQRITLRTVLITALLVVAITVAVAAVLSPTASIFGWFYGANMQEKLLQGDIIPSGESVQVGEVIYVLTDIIYKEGTIYGSGTMKAAEGSDVILLCEDYTPGDPAGYSLIYGGEKAPAGTPTYGEKAAETNAKLITVHCLPNGVIGEDGSLQASNIGYAFFPRQDGTIDFMFELDDAAWQNSYTLEMYCANWEIAPDGEHLTDTKQKTDWVVTVTPTK